MSGFAKGQFRKDTDDTSHGFLRKDYPHVHASGSVYGNRITLETGIELRMKYKLYGDARELMFRPAKSGCDLQGIAGESCRPKEKGGSVTV